MFKTTNDLYNWSLNPVQVSLFRVIKVCAETKWIKALKKYYIFYQKFNFLKLKSIFLTSLDTLNCG